MGKWEDKGNGSFEKVSGLFFADMTEFDDDGLQWEVWIHSRFGERTPKVAQCHFSSTREEAEAWADAALLAFNASSVDPRKVREALALAEAVEEIRRDVATRRMGGWNGQVTHLAIQRIREQAARIAAEGKGDKHNNNADDGGKEGEG